MEVLLQFGQNLRAARISMGLSQSILGKVINADSHYICALEDGAVDPAMSEVAALAIALGCTTQALVTGIPIQPELIRELCMT